MNQHVTAVDNTTIRLERLLPGPIERVWSYLTDSEKRGQWFASGAFELKVGGKAELVFDHDNISDERYPADALKHKGKVVTGTVVRCEPPRLLTFNWGPEPTDSEITFELTHSGDNVLLTITHRNIQTRDLKVNYASGWDTHTAILEDILTGTPRRPFWTAHRELVKSYEQRI